MREKELNPRSELFPVENSAVHTVLHDQAISHCLWSLLVLHSRGVALLNYLLLSLITDPVLSSFPPTRAVVIILFNPVNSLWGLPSFWDFQGCLFWFHWGIRCQWCSVEQLQQEEVPSYPLSFWAGVYIPVTSTGAILLFSLPMIHLCKPSMGIGNSGHSHGAQEEGCGSCLLSNQGGFRISILWM